VSAGTARPPGWYDDATDAAVLRYWDGSGWTPHTSRRAGRSLLDERTHVVGESDVALTARFPGPAPAATPDHTTVPTPPMLGPAGGPEPDLGPDSLHAVPRMPLPLLSVAGAITAAASLVVAFAALGVALGR
jgi:hypothetical protein